MDKTVVIKEHINYTEVSRRTGIDVSVISKIFNRKRVPNFQQAKKMADAMGVSLDELYRILYKETACGRKA